MTEERRCRTDLYGPEAALTCQCDDCSNKRIEDAGWSCKGPSASGVYIYSRIHEGRRQEIGVPLAMEKGPRYILAAYLTKKSETLEEDMQRDRKDTSKRTSTWAS